MLKWESTMSDPSQPQMASATTPDGGTPAPLDVVPASIVASPAASSKPKKVRLAQRLATAMKKVAWRVTGVYVWCLVVFRLFGYSDFGTDWSRKLASYLADAGFKPVDSSHLAKTIEIGWILVITGFKSIEMIGLSIYLLWFPFLPLTLYLTHGIEGQPTSDSTGGAIGLAKHRRRLAFSVVGLVLLAWFILFGDTVAKRPAVIGAVFSGALFLLLTARAFQRVRPDAEPNPNFLRVPKLVGLSLLKGFGTQLKDGSIKTKGAAVFSERTYRLIKAFYRFLAISTRGAAGRNRIYDFVLGEYVVSLIMLAASAVLFWAMLDKAALSPTSLSLSYFLSLTAASIFPALPTVPPPPGLSRILLVAPSLSAWILFVLYVGPASSLLSFRQAAYAKNVADAHKIFRKFTVAFGKYIAYLKRVSKKLP